MVRISFTIYKKEKGGKAIKQNVQINVYIYYTAQ